MSSIPKKKKKEKLKLKKGKREENKNNEEKVQIIYIPQIKSSYEILSSINNDLDLLSNNMRNKKIFKEPFLFNNDYKVNTVPLLDNNFNYDKEDFEMKDLINRANIYLNNNTQRKFIQSYENKLIQSDNNYDYNNYKNLNNNFKYNNFNNISSNLPFNNNYNYQLRNDNIRKENFIKPFINNFVNRKKEIPKNRFFFNPKYNSQRNKTKSKKYILKNSFDDYMNRKTKKLENINLYVNNFKRKPIVYTQADSIKLSRNIFPKNRNLSEDLNYLRYKEKYKKYLRRNDDKAIDILKSKI